MMKILVTREVNPACIYRVKFFINGLRTSVIVDDFVPVLSQSQMPAFFSSQRQFFWALLIEKAWAKINGSYFRIRKGAQSMLGMHLTGIPAENIQHNEIKYFENGCWNTNTDKADLFWQKLVAALERDYTVIGESKTNN